MGRVNKKREGVNLLWKCDPGYSLSRSKKKIFPFLFSLVGLETGPGVKLLTASH
jgi:hypothetical protein